MNDNYDEIKAFVYKYFKVVIDKGNDWFVNCCYHDEKTPSLSIDKMDGIHNCFGCHVGGDFKKLKLKFGIVEDYERKIDGMKNDEWNKIKNKLNGNDIENKNGRSYYKQMPHGFRYIDDRDFNTKYYHYLQERNISYKTIRLFKIGYVDNELSRFNGRVIIPVYDENGKFAFPEGRLIDNNIKDRKYLRPANINCKQFLFNYNHAKLKNYVIVSEGVMDTISIVQWGINGVSGFNPVLSDKQIELLMIFNKIYFAFGNDESGNNGIKHAVKNLRNKGIQLYKLNYLRNEDANKIDEEKFKQVLANAQKMNFFTEEKI